MFRNLYLHLGTLQIFSDKLSLVIPLNSKSLMTRKMHMNIKVRTRQKPRFLPALYTSFNALFYDMKFKGRKSWKLSNSNFRYRACHVAFENSTN